VPVQMSMPHAHLYIHTDPKPMEPAAQPPKEWKEMIAKIAKAKEA